MEVVMDEEIRNAMESEIRRLNEEEEDIKNAMEIEIKRLKEEEELEEKKLMEEKEIRDMRFKFVIHVSPLEIIDDHHHNVVAAAAAGHVLAENKIELVIDVIHHHYIYQYWSPPLKTRFMGDSSSSTVSSSLCQHHDYLHPRDDDDEDMILTSCRPFCDPPQRIKIVTLLDQGVFAAAASTEDDEHIISTTTLLGDLDVLFSEYRIISTQERLQDVKTSIARRICEAKAHVLSMEKPPKRISTCVDVSWAAKKYYASAEAATFVSAMDTATDASFSMDQCRRQVLPWRLLHGHRV